MILCVLLVVQLLNTQTTRAAGENYMSRHSKPEVPDDEMEIINSGYLLSREERIQSNKIITKNRLQVYHVELLVMLDYSIYKWWLKLNGKDPQKTEYDLMTFYSYLINMVRSSYNAINISGKRVDFSVVGIKIAKTKREVPFIENEQKVNKNSVDPHLVLTKLSQWLKTERKKLPKHDVLAFLTKYDMGIYNGMGMLGAACTVEALSITKERSLFDTAHTLAHEIGHNLGAHHDNKTGCTLEDQYIMASSVSHLLINKTFGNRNKLSSCSVGYFGQYIQIMNKYKSNCLVIRNSNTHISVDDYTRQPFGSVFDVEKQCQILYGPKSFFCAGGFEDYVSMCRQLICWNATAKMCYRTARAAAGDGIPCDNKRICKNEECVYDPSASSGNEGCFYGDWKGQLKDDRKELITCEVVMKRQYLCYYHDVKVKCCNTCKNIYNPKQQNCEYGDKVANCKRSQCSYNNGDRLFYCCKTCALDKSKTCEFGDKGLWCNEITSYNCYNYNDTCCESCKRFEDKTKSDCRYGDKIETCKEQVRITPKICKESKSKMDCCASCEKISPSSCIDWDLQYCAAVNRVLCYHDHVREICCKTCENYKIRDAPTGCEYGDLLTGCKRERCPNYGKNKNKCCYTCNGY